MLQTGALAHRSFPQSNSYDNGKEEPVNDELAKVFNLMAQVTQNTRMVEDSPTLRIYNSDYRT